MRPTSHCYIPFPRQRLARLLAILSLALIAGCSSPEEQAQSHYERGAEYLQAGDPTRAMLEFRNAVKLDEKLGSAWSGIARIEEEAKNWQATVRALRKVVELDRSHVEARTKLAKLLLAGGDIERALALANEANTLAPDNSEIHALRGAILLRLNDRAGARVDAERALSLDRENAEAYAVLAADAMLDDNTAAALRFVDRGLQSDAQNNGLLLFKLKLHESEKDFQSAESVMRRLIVANPDNKDLRRGLVAFLLERKRPQDAETEMRALVAVDPADAALALELVQFAGTTKGPEAGRRELVRLIEAHPQTVDYRLAMARLDMSQARAQAAVESLQGIVSRAEPVEDVQRARLLLAEFMLKDGKSDAAANLLAEVLAADERNVDALALRADLRLKSGDYENATADLREALNQEPQSVRLLLLQARVFERQGVVDLADDNFVQAVRIANYAPAVALDYASFLSNRGDLARADAILSESLSRVPNNSAVLSALGRIRLSQQDWAGAEDVAKLLKSIGDGSGAGDQILGAALLGQQKFDDSIETLKLAFAATPEAVQPLYSLFAAYMRSGDRKGAEDLVASLLAASPGNADAHVLNGLLHAMKNEQDQAVAAYETAIERQPKKGVGYRALAGHLIAAGKLDEAESVLVSGRREAPDDMALNLVLAGLLEQKPDPDSALALYEELLERRPDGLILVNNVASLIAEHRSDEASLARAYQLALRLRDVDIAQFKDTLGWVHYRRGDYQAAIDYLEAAVESLPEHGLVRYHLAKAYAALDRLDEAKAELAKAAELVGEGDELADKIREALIETGKPRSLN